MGRNQITSEELLGCRLHGEGLDDAGLVAWLAEEIDGFAQIAGAGSPCKDSCCQSGARVPSSRRQEIRLLPRFGRGLGGEYEALAGRVGRYVAVEPGRTFWRGTIAGSPAEYRMPTLRGTVDLPDGACDLACGFGVLHHIANVSEVVTELARVLAPGGFLILREPIHSLGDFRRPRAGLTRNERGIPHGMMDDMLKQSGLGVVAKSFAGFPLIQRMWLDLGGSDPWESKLFVTLDRWLCRVSAWNIRYWRNRPWQKLAPQMAYWVAQKPPG